MLVLLGEPKLALANLRSFIATDRSGQTNWALLQMPGDVHCDPEFAELTKISEDDRSASRRVVQQETMSDFFSRLRERKLVQWALAYIAAAFALIQVADIVAQRFGWPEQAIRFVIVALGVGFFLVLVLAWYHGERGRQRVNGTELLILALLLGIGGVAIWRLAPEPATKRAADKSGCVGRFRASPSRCCRSTA